ncbi:MAG: hypothetical protein A3H98_03655 [Bacteroidetes bacterium RIFCSPLOWO2_02_FULL_36_8]|nr:MAG: hypothetical protein A3H98_03655 [Bacteroidetes bacterium RIFCSPLOWO2_02_FULL_36_8]OFY69537.1 MAG: hypothetical protein A3G23_10900 [Bacteroidetes bacterium RIFCSPLOWO2_12_FULL_37_12]
MVDICGGIVFSKLIAIMKHFILILTLLSFETALGQGSWVKKADFPGGARSEAAGFAIGSKGYIGTGRDANIAYKDFWEYNPTNDSWTKKADFGGSERFSAAAFALKSMGVLGTGIKTTGAALFDCWIYDPSNDTWKGTANVAQGIIGAASASNGEKGFFVTGMVGTQSDQLWIYDTTTTWLWDSWKNFPGNARNSSAAFAIGSKLYVGTGAGGGSVYFKDFWEYDIPSDTWTRKADFPGVARYGASAFAIGERGYIGLGSSGTFPYQKDFWEYDPKTDKWRQVADFAINGRYYSVSFVINGKAYVGTGAFSVDFYEFTPPAPDVGFEELSTSRIQLYPVPAIDKVYFDLNSYYHNSSFRLSNALGQVCKSGVITDLTIDISDLKAGFYYMQIMSESDRYRGIVIKK